MPKETNKLEKNRDSTKSQNQTFDESSKALAKIRPELNIERWLSIWQPTHSKNKKTRILTRIITDPTGNKLTSEVEIGYVDRRGTLTTEDQKTYYALIKQWEDKGRPTQQTFFSLRQLAKILKKKWGTRTIETLSDSLKRLRIVPFIWRNSYFDNTTKETIKILDTFNILSELKIIQKEKDGVVNKEFGYFRFNDHILKNLLANHTKPLYFDVVLNFKSEIAQLLYTYIDRIMANRSFNEPYVRRTEDLFKGLGLEGKKYIYPSKRKEKLEPALKELQGIELSTGILVEARLELAKDKKDYKVIFRKQPKQEKEEVIEEEPQKPIFLPQPNPKAKELVEYFHEKLHHIGRQPTSKELNQATALIAQYGYDKAKYTVDHALNLAQETNFKMQNFGAVLTYASEASAIYDKEKQEEEKMKIIRFRLEKEEKERQEELQRKAQEKKEALKNFYLSLPEEKKQKVKILVQQAIDQKAFPYFFYPKKIDPSSQFYPSIYEMNEDEILKILKQHPNLLEEPPDIQKLISVSLKTKPILEGESLRE